MEEGSNTEVQPSNFVRLALSGGDGRGVWCDGEGVYIGPGIALVKRQRDQLGQIRFAPMPADRLRKVLGYGYDEPIDVEPLLPGLERVAAALQKGDLAFANIALVQLGIAPFENGLNAELAAAADALLTKWNADQHPRHPAGAEDSQGGRFVPKDEAGDASAMPASRVDAATATSEADAAGSNAKGVPVELPNGQKVPDPNSTSGFMMSPVADLGPVAAAGRSAGETFRAMLADPESAAGASTFLALSTGVNVGQGGVYDYQREGNHITGFTQLPQYRDVSNFNVGLFCQQAGYSLDDTLSISGVFARFLSSNAKPDQPYHLDPQTAAFITAGYEAGASGVFGQSAH